MKILAWIGMIIGIVLLVVSLVLLEFAVVSPGRTTVRQGLPTPLSAPPAR